MQDYIDGIKADVIIVPDWDNISVTIIDKVDEEKEKEILSLFNETDKLEAVVAQINMHRKGIVALFQSVGKKAQERYKKKYPKLYNQLKLLNKEINNILDK